MSSFTEISSWRGTFGFCINYVTFFYCIVVEITRMCGCASVCAHLPVHRYNWMDVHTQGASKYVINVHLEL